MLFLDGHMIVKSFSHSHFSLGYIWHVFQLYRAGPVFVMEQAISFLESHRQYLKFFSPVAVDDPPSPPGPPEGDNGFSCNCGRCVEMPTDREQLCCRSRSRGRCVLVTASTVMARTIMDQVTLEVAVQTNNIVYADRDDHHQNVNLRHMAYRQYVIWYYGKLGAGNRVVVPSCVVTEIRRRYPSADGHYTGFIPSVFF